MAIDLKHALAVGGIAVVALGAGIGIARATGDEKPPKPPATPAASQAELPSVPDAAPVKVTELGDVAALPARRAAVRRRSASGGATPNSTPSPSTPSTTPAPNATAAPPAATAAPVAPVAPQPSTPQPARTPAVGGGTGGEEP